MNEPHTHPTRVTVSGSDLTPRLYQAHEAQPNRERALLVGKAIFIVILVWLIGIAFLSTGSLPVQHATHLLTTAVPS